jgi:hypothetical protein
MGLKMNLYVEHRLIECSVQTGMGENGRNKKNQNAIK